MLVNDLFDTDLRMTSRCSRGDQYLLVPFHRISDAMDTDTVPYKVSATVASN